MNQFCECTVDGYCQRYERIMAGRWREICAGVQCDLGTSAAFRQQWAREASMATIQDVMSIIRGTDKPPPTPLLLITDQAPGDTVAMTAAVYSLHRAHPGKYLTAVQSPHPEVWQHNPDVVTIPKGDERTWNVLHMHYPAIHQSNQRAIHFMQGWCEHLSNALGVSVPLLTNRPHLYFDEPITYWGVSNMWLVCSGGKQDLTNKLWGQHNYQNVVDILRGKVSFAQVGHRDDNHPRLEYTFDMVGSSLRGLFDIVRRARGVLCGVSLLMHVAAALGKPAIVIAGGREPVAWNAYPNQQYLHTVGVLPCTPVGGLPQENTGVGRVGGACWRSRVVPLGDGTELDRDTCQRPIDGIPECMRMISPARVAELILCYDRNYER